MPSFDVVSKADPQEVKNGVEQAKKELDTRYDFKGSKSSIEWREKENLIILVADDKMKLTALQDILKTRLAKRSVSLKMVEFVDPVPAGGDTIKQEVKIKQGLADTDLKRLNKLVKESGIKVSSQIQGDQLRVSGKKRDDLQLMIAKFKASVADLELQFVNFRD